MESQGTKLVKDVLKATIIYIISVILIVLNEYFKEGYFIKLSDFLKPFTHEFIILIITLLYIAYLVLYLKRRKQQL